MGIVGVVGVVGGGEEIVQFLEQSWEWDVEGLDFDSPVLDVVFYGGRGRGLIGSSGRGLMGGGH